MGELNLRDTAMPGARRNRLLSRRRTLAPIAAAGVALLVGCGAGASSDEQLKMAHATAEGADNAYATDPTPKSWFYDDAAATESGAGAVPLPTVDGGGLPGVGKPPTSGSGHATISEYGTYDYYAAGFTLQNPCDIIPDEVFRREGLRELPDGRINDGVEGQDQLCAVTGGSADIVFVSSYVNQHLSNLLGHTHLHFTGPDNSTYAVIREEPDAVMCTVGADTAMGFFGVAAIADEAPLYMNDMETCTYLNDTFVGYFADYPELIGAGRG